ncbi:Mpr protein [Rhodococcus pyridinivorans]|uniref:DUF4352 domain-containing protein n=1 Tax=Rhodococcus TaxID=1827 RepID=UPI0002DBF076|nr:MULTISPECIES: DUF4352 domain-containing protein [Rhodococcus]AWZ22869.1 Mpr protein [Rhodococcus pyridinivorans]MCD2097531.1 DUF4352 domain-containing protein [Rhodococcus rhodochrous]MCD2122753.1 DUF4352 domain-containing protein [Rhodococcus rhodochrous]MCD5421091.1 DUF4352 domain-containing protein [Rhodococcus pyridinivorans]MCQ4133642.1 DUF4352 domain-containing protein [Rhodococcus rhodochrous]
MTMPHQPGAPVPPAGNAPAPQKKSKKWPWIVGGIAAVVVIASVSGGGDDEKPTTPTNSDNPAVQVDAPAAAEEDTTAAMNIPVRDGKFEFVVTGVESGLTSLGDNPFLAEEAQGQFVVVTMTVSNISDEPKSLSPSDQKLIDGQGRTFSPDTSAALNLDSDVPIWDKINPGNTVTMPVVFDMPVDAVPTAIELHDSMFSGGVTVSLQ